MIFSFRRLDSRDPDDYDAKEKAETMKAVTAVCNEIASKCKNGYNIPWDLKASIAEVLLRGCFDSFDESSLIDEVDELDEVDDVYEVDEVDEIDETQLYPSHD